MHHLDDNKKTILKDGSEIKLTDYSNCIFVEMLPGDMNFSHNLLTLIQKYGSLTKLMDKLTNLRIITVDKNGKLTEIKFSDYIK